MTSSRPTSWPSSSSHPSAFGFALMSPRPSSAAHTKANCERETSGKMLSPPCGDLPVGRFVDRGCRVFFLIFRKIFWFPRTPNQIENFSHPVPQEGRIAIVTDAGWGAVDAAAFCARRDRRAGWRKACERSPSERTRDAARVRRSRVVLTPRRWRQVRGVKSAQPGLDKTYPWATVAKEPGRRGEHEISRKTIACGNVGDSGVLVVTRVR